MLRATCGGGRVFFVLHGRIYTNSSSPALAHAPPHTHARQDGRYIVAGGSGANEAKVFDHRSDNAVVGTVTNLQRGIFTVDFAPSGDQVAIAGGMVPA